MNAANIDQKPPQVVEPEFAEAERNKIGLARDAFALSWPNYWGENKEFPRADWKHLVYEADTLLGYWEWVAEEMRLRG